MKALVVLPRRGAFTARLAPIGLAALVATTWVPWAHAQGTSFKLHCHDVGYNAAQPLGDREGHALMVGQYTCRVEGGPLDGGMVTGHNVWEWDKANAVLVAHYSVIRKPGAVVVGQNSEGNLALTLGSDGKVTGWTATGKGNNRMASGAAAAWAGKSFTWTAVPTGAGQFVVDVKHD